MSPADVPEIISGTRKGFPLRVVSLAGLCWEGRVREASLPGADGRFGIMAGHLPLLAPLVDGFIHLFPEQGGAPLQLHVSGGYVEVQPAEVIVLADLAARSDALDAARAEEARQLAASPMAAAFSDDQYPPLHAELVARLARIRGPGRR
jgi:F-type H+-transporting ATPase subunit epsilon